MRKLATALFRGEFLPPTTLSGGSLSPAAINVQSSVEKKVVINLILKEIYLLTYLLTM